MTIYELYKYTPKEIVEVEYLLEQAKRFHILDAVQEAFFQFSPDLVKKKIEGFAEHEPWAVSHKRHIINEIVFYLLNQTIENEYEYDREYWSDKQIWHEVFTPFVLQTDMRDMDNETLFLDFLNFMEKIEL